MPGKKLYQITQTTSTTYLDKSGRVINGFTVWADLIEWDEMHPVTVSSLEPAVVDRSVKELINKRKGLDTLGE